MHCPQCGVDQPMGVTVCGFCGAAMAGSAPVLRQGEAEAIWRGAAQVGRAARRTRRWLTLAAAAALAGLSLGWIAMTLAGAREAGDGAADSQAATAEPSDAVAGVAGDAADPAPTPVAAEAALARGRGVDRLDEARLGELADELARLAAGGDAAELARWVDARARYRLRVEDAAEVRDLRGGKPELLAHWLTPWMVAELDGGSSDDVFDIERVAVEFDRRRGYVVRRVESAGDVSRLRFPRALLVPLGLRGELELATAGGVDFGPFRDRGERCAGRETVHFATSPAGVKVVEVDRVGSCRRDG